MLIIGDSCNFPFLCDEEEWECEILFDMFKEIGVIA
jgi:hypothetical protein